MLKNGSKLNEKILCEIWKNKVLQKEFKTFSDESIMVINAGTENNDIAGPDFLNAKVRIGNLVYVGDVEIDVDYTDWKSHGHYLDKRYNKVVVHASLINRNQSSHVYCKDGRKIPSICLAEYFEDELGEISREELNDNSKQNTHYLIFLWIKRLKKISLRNLALIDSTKRKKKYYSD